MYVPKEVMPIREQFQFKHIQRTILREWNKDRTQFSMEYLRKRPVAISVIFDYVNKTITIGSTVYATKFNSEYTYRFKKRDKIIEMMDYVGFVRFLKEALPQDSLWHNTAWNTLKQASSNHIIELS